MKQKPEVGQVLYSLNIGNAARNVAQELTPVIVTKVGRKYFYCNIEGYPDHMQVKYDLDSWVESSNYSATSCVYTNKQEWEDEKLASELTRSISEYFRYPSSAKLSLDQLIEIKSILDGQS